MSKLKGVRDIKKQTIQKIDYFVKLLVFLILIIHIIACLWLKVGETVEDSWINNKDGIGVDTTPSKKYITSFYWVVATLTTVGYGDFKGLTTQEYIFTMFVEFCGILFFSIMMGSINEIFLDTGGEVDVFEDQLESVDIWLVKLDSTRLEKQLPRVLYDKIRHYIRESKTHDHKKLVDGNEFLS